MGLHRFVATFREGFNFAQKPNAGESNATGTHRATSVTQRTRFSDPSFLRFFVSRRLREKPTTPEPCIGAAESESMPEPTVGFVFDTLSPLLSRTNL